MPRPHPLTRRNGLVNQVDFLGLAHALRQCNLASIKIFCSQPAQKRYGCSNGDEQILRKVRNNYRSRNLIGHYPFWVISPRNLTSFTRPFLAGRRARAGHETNRNQPHSELTSTSIQNTGCLHSDPVIQVGVYLRSNQR